MTDEHSNSEQASAEAVHKAKNAAQAVENARAAQVEEAAMRAAECTKKALLEGLKEIFTDDNNKTPQEMRILIQRVPIICTNIMQMHEALGRTDASVERINTNISRVVWLVITAVLLALLKLVLIP